MSGPRVLITGGAGYVGSVMCKEFLEKGYRVSALDNFMYGQKSLLDCCRYEDFEIIRGDCRDPGLMGNALKDKDIVIPLAAIVGAPACAKDTARAESTNLEAVRLICRLTSREQRLLFPVTNSGYGIGENHKFCTEESPLKPLSLYGHTKVAAEQAVLERANAITFRLATIFGVSPRMRVDLLVNDFTYRALIDKTLTLYEGHFKRNFIHVRDVTKAFLHGLEHFAEMKNRPYNVGLEDANLSKIELCEAIKRHIPGFVYNEEAIGEDPDKRDYMVSNQRILATGWIPDWSLDRGIRELIKCYTIVTREGLGND